MTSYLCWEILFTWIAIIPHSLMIPFFIQDYILFEFPQLTVKILISYGYLIANYIVS